MSARWWPSAASRMSSSSLFTFEPSSCFLWRSAVRISSSSSGSIWIWGLGGAGFSSTTLAGALRDLDEDDSDLALAGVFFLGVAIPFASRNLSRKAAWSGQKRAHYSHVVPNVKRRRQARRPPP